MSPNRWGKETDKAIANFAISGEQMPWAIVDALAHIKEHAAQANRAFGVLDEVVAQAIVEAAREIRRGEHATQFPVDVFQTGSGTSTNMNVNEVIANRATELCGRDVHANDDVNASQSSNDVFPTAVRMAVVRGITEGVVPALEHLAVRLDELAAAHQNTVKAGRTHLMDAAPITFGQEVGGWSRSIRINVERFSGTVDRLRELPLGGTAVGTGLNSPTGFAAHVIAGVSRDLGVEYFEAVDHFEAQSSPEVLVEASAMTRSAALALNKISADLRLLSSGPRCGLGEIVLPEMQAGSSIMPGKVNPVIPEVVQQVAAQVIGNDAAIAFAAATGSMLQLNTAMPVIARNLLSSLHLLSRAARSLADLCVAGVEVDVEQMKSYAERSPALATALTPHIGYESATELVKRALQTQRPIADVARESDIPEDVLRLLDPLLMTRRHLMP